MASKRKRDNNNKDTQTKKPKKESKWVLEFSEHNEWEGETWHTFVSLDRAIKAKEDEVVCRFVAWFNAVGDDTWTVRVEKRSTAYILLDRPSNTGYLPEYSEKIHTPLRHADLQAFMLNHAQKNRVGIDWYKGMDWFGTATKTQARRLETLETDAAEVTPHVPWTSDCDDDDDSSDTDNDEPADADLSAVTTKYLYTLWFEGLDEALAVLTLHAACVTQRDAKVIFKQTWTTLPWNKRLDAVTRLLTHDTVASKLDAFEDVYRRTDHLELAVAIGASPILEHALAKARDAQYESEREEGEKFLRAVLEHLPSDALDAWVTTNGGHLTLWGNIDTDKQPTAFERFRGHRIPAALGTAYYLAHPTQQQELVDAVAPQSIVPPQWHRREKEDEWDPDLFFLLMVDRDVVERFDDDAVATAVRHAVKNPCKRWIPLPLRADSDERTPKRTEGAAGCEPCVGGIVYRITRD